MATTRDGTTIRYRLLADTDVTALYGQLRDVAAARMPDVEAARRSYLGTQECEATEQIGREELLRRAHAGQVVGARRPARP